VGGDLAFLGFSVLLLGVMFSFQSPIDLNDWFEVGYTCWVISGVLNNLLSLFPTNSL